MPAKLSKFYVGFSTAGRIIVEAKDAKAAKRKAPKQWKQYKGEIYVEKFDETSVCYRWKHAHVFGENFYDRLRLQNKTWYMVFANGQEIEANSGFAASLFEAVAADLLVVVKDANVTAETKA